jgi:hypothetical protein
MGRMKRLNGHLVFGDIPTEELLELDPNAICYGVGCVSRPVRDQNEFWSVIKGRPFCAICVTSGNLPPEFEMTSDDGKGPIQIHLEDHYDDYND